MIQEKNGLIVEFRGCRDLLESTRMHCDTMRIRMSIEGTDRIAWCRIRKSTQHKQCATVDRGCNAIPYKDKTVEATLAQLSQEKMTSVRRKRRCAGRERTFCETICRFGMSRKGAVTEAQEAGVLLNKPGIVGGIGEGEGRARDEYSGGAGTGGSYFVRRGEDARECRGSQGGERIYKKEMSGKIRTLAMSLNDG